MPELNFKLNRLFIFVACLWLVSACAQPAHKNTMPWNLSVSTTEINMVAPNKYLIDGLYYELASLKHYLAQRHQAGIRMPIVLTSPDELNLLTRRNYFEMASIAKIAEALDLEVYYSRAHLVHLQTSSLELLSLSDKQNMPIISGD